MNRTTEGSKQKAILVGGDTIPLENGKIQIPPEQAKTNEEVIANIEMGNFKEISTGNCKAEDVLTPEQIKILKHNRKQRKTRNSKKQQNQR